MESFLAAPHNETVIQPEEFLQKVKARENMFVVDVREPKELEETGFIKGAVNIPVRQVAARIEEFPKDLGTPIVVYCASGHRSSHAAVYLRAYGYRDVKNLEYGMHGWTEQELSARTQAIVTKRRCRNYPGPSFRRLIKAESSVF